MRARIKATGEIVHVGDYNTIFHDPKYRDESIGPWRLEEIELIDDDPDYWTRLEHQYAGMAMQGILSNSEYLRSLMHTKHNDYRAHEVVPHVALRLSHALVEKMKEVK